MPSYFGTPGGLAITGGDGTFTPARWAGTAGVLRVAGASASFGGGTTSLSITTPDLNTQKRQLPIGEARNGQVFVTAQEQLRQQRQKEAIEAAFAALTQQVADNTAILAQIQAAQNLAQSASDTANSVSSAQDLSSSYTNPTSVLSAANDGSITIATHERVYPISQTTVSVAGAAISGFAAGAYVTVFYDDAGRTGGVVSYQGTTNAVAQQGVTHVVGGVTIPQPGEAPETGASPTAPGYVPPEFDPGTDYR